MTILADKVHVKATKFTNQKSNPSERLSQIW